MRTPNFSDSVAYLAGAIDGPYDYQECAYHLSAVSVFLDSGKVVPPEWFAMFPDTLRRECLRFMTAEIFKALDARDN
jgi:hypothetical protein